MLKTNHETIPFFYLKFRTKLLTHTFVLVFTRNECHLVRMLSEMMIQQHTDEWSDSSKGIHHTHRYAYYIETEVQLSGFWSSNTALS
jgi:hypothetical protein